MPTYVITTPEGIKYRVTAPEGASQAEVMARVQAQHQQAQQNRPTSFWHGVNDSIHTASSNLGALLEKVNPVEWALDAAGNALGHHFPTQAELDAKYRQREARSPTRPSTAGKIVGGVLATVPTMLIPGEGLVGAGLQGAASGALLTDKRDPASIAKNTALGAAGGMFGNRLAKGVGALVGGKNVSQNARLLANEGITLTPGQLGGKGSIANTIEDKILGSLPVLDAIPASAARRAENDLRVAVANRVLKPIGETVTKGTPINNSAIAGIQDKVYSNLDNAAGNLNLSLDPELALGMSKVVSDAPRLVGDEGTKQIQANVSNIAQRLTQGDMSGQPLRDTLNELRGTASGAQGELRNQLWNLHDTVAEALARQNPPDASQAFNSARESATLLKRMEDAASRGGITDGEFGPTQLLQAAKRRGYGTTTSNIASGDARLLDLANAAGDVMRNKTANSGTPGRLLAATGLLGGGTASLAHVNPLAAAAVGSQLLGYIPGVAEVLQKAALNRPPAMQAIGRSIENAAPYVGMFGAPVLLNAGGQ